MKLEALGFVERVRAHVMGWDVMGCDMCDAL